MEQRIIDRIDEKKVKLDKLRPLSTGALNRIREDFGVEQTYNSNAIEGNTLTLQETKMVLEEGVTIKGKPLKDHLEAKNHKEAVDLLFEIVNKRTDITEALILEVHEIILKDIESDFAGVYRKEQVRILGADFIPPNYLKVPQLMAEYVEWLRSNPEKLGIIELAAKAHYEIARIHPFVDGNGRVARLVMNIVLMKEGYPPMTILNNDRGKYLRSLSAANTGNMEPFILLLAQAVERSLDLYLMASGAESGELVSLSVLARGTRYSEKYLNLLARKGLLEAIKLKRNWLSTKNALERYVETRERRRK